MHDHRNLPKSYKWAESLLVEWFPGVHKHWDSPQNLRIPGNLAHPCHLSTQNIEARRSEDGGSTQLCSRFEASLGCTSLPISKQERKKYNLDNKIDIRICPEITEQCIKYILLMCITACDLGEHLTKDY